MCFNDVKCVPNVLAACNAQLPSDDAASIEHSAIGLCEAARL